MKRPLLLLLLGLVGGLLLSIGVAVYLIFFHTIALPRNILISQKTAGSSDYLLLHLAENEFQLIHFPVNSEMALPADTKPEVIRSLLSRKLGVVIDDTWLLDTTITLPKDSRGVFNFLINLLRRPELSFAQRLLLLELLAQTDPANVQFHDLSGLEESSLSFAEGSAQCSIALINTTDISGLAASVAALLRRQDFRVVRIENANEEEAVSHVAWTGDDAYCEAVALRLRALFPQEEALQQNPELLQNYRADIVLFLGRDLGN